MRTYTQSEKQQIIQEVAETGSISAVSRKHGIAVSTIHSWLKSKKSLVSTSKNEENNKELIIKLKKQLSDATLENKILKDLLKKTYQVWDPD